MSIKKKRIGVLVVGGMTQTTFGMAVHEMREKHGIGRECLAASIIPATPSVVHAVNKLNELDEKEAKKKAKESRLEIEIRDCIPAPIQPATIKKDGAKFFDSFYSRNRRPRSQQFSQHFKK